MYTQLYFTIYSTFETVEVNHVNMYYINWCHAVYVF